MKTKFFSTIISLIILSISFFTSVSIYDYFREQNLKANLQKIKIGMTKAEIIEILGKPDHVWSSDTPTLSWCYDTNSITHSLEEQPDIECGHMLLQTSSSYKDSEIKVLKIYRF